MRYSKKIVTIIESWLSALSLVRYHPLLYGYSIIILSISTISLRGNYTTPYFEQKTSAIPLPRNHQTKLSSTLSQLIQEFPSPLSYCPFMVYFSLTNSFFPLSHLLLKFLHSSTPLPLEPSTLSPPQLLTFPMALLPLTFLIPSIHLPHSLSFCFSIV